MESCRSVNYDIILAEGSWMQGGSRPQVQTGAGVGNQQVTVPAQGPLSHQPQGNVHQAVNVKIFIIPVSLLFLIHANIQS